MRDESTSATSTHRISVSYSVFEWLVAARADEADEADEVRIARLKTMPDARLLLLMVGAWSIGGPVLALALAPAWWAVVWLITAVAVFAARLWLTHRCHESTARFQEHHHVALASSYVLSFVVLAAGIFGMIVTAEPQLVATGIVLTLGWMSYVASRQAAFIRLGSLHLYILGWTLAVGLLASTDWWILGIAAYMFPVAYQVMMAQNHTIITTALQAQHENRRLSMTDPLTGLPNRLGLDAWVADRVARRTDGDDVEFATLCLDLDGFKAINDSYGHPVGDCLLRAVSARLASHLRTNEIVCRVGGDEFVVLIEGIPRHTATRMADRLVEAVSAEFDLGEGMLVSVGISAGVALYPEDGNDPDTVLARADAELYAVKHAR